MDTSVSPGMYTVLKLDRRELLDQLEEAQTEAARVGAKLQSLQEAVKVYDEIITEVGDRLGVNG